MSTDEHVPSEEDAADNYVAGRGSDDPGLSLPELRAEYGPEFDRFLARVRRDAAREAIIRLRDHLARARGYNLIGPDGLDYYIRREHPEETP